MKYLLANIVANLVAIACVAASAFLAVNNKDGWGWFLFVACCCATTVSFNKSK